MIERRVIIFSTGRAGTSLLSRMFDGLDLGQSLAHQSPGSRRLNILGNLLLQCRKNRAAKIAGSMYRRLKGTEIPYSTADPLLSILIAVYLQDAEHRAEMNWNFVHLVRDPRDFVTSFMNWKAQKFRRGLLHHFVPFWQPSPVLSGEYNLLTRLNMSKFEHFCWIWNFKNSYFKETFERSGRYFLLRLEDLVDRERGPDVFQNLLTFLDISSTRQDLGEWLKNKVNNSDIQRFPGWKNWSTEQARILDSHCGPLMKALGYGKEPHWLDLLNSNRSISVRSI